MKWNAVQISSGRVRNFHVQPEEKSGQFTCRFCKGRGKDRAPWEGLCPVCSGRGYIFMTGSHIGDCAFCGGRGRAEPATSNLCSACNGRGLVYLPESFETCPSCKGLGRGPGVRIPCKQCSGKGVVEKEKEKNE